MSEVLAQLAGLRIVPVVVLDDPSAASGLAQALVAGGLPVAEVTLRTDAGLAAIATLAREGDVLVGAGTVTEQRQVDAAVDAGAQFIVTPALDRGVVERCRALGVLCLPGIATPTEVVRARALGLNALKLFPASALGGVNMVRSLAGPFPDIRLLATGGISSAADAEPYLAEPTILAVGGSWMVPRAAILHRRFDEITRLTAQASALTRPPRDC